MPITITTTIYDYDEFEQLVKDTYGINFSVVADLESANDTTHDMGSISNTWYSDYDEQEFLRWKREKRGTYLTGAIINALCVDGVIPPGNYQISVSW